MSYDAKGSRLFIFGGWNDDWLCDLYSLDVGNIVGPPYAITDMYPNIGMYIEILSCFHSYSFL
jgi:dynein heavy chain